jgi:hypothetical protein
MPPYPKPFFKPKRNSRYVEVDRTQYLLGKHPEGLPTPKKRVAEWGAPREILDAYHARMADLQQQADAVPAAASDAPPAVATVLDEFTASLEWRPRFADCNA